MHSRYDLMRASSVEDIDGVQFPDPLTVDYNSFLENERVLPQTYTFTRPDLKKLWKKYYENTNKTEDDDILYNLNGIEHVGLIEPEDFIYIFDTSKVKQYTFKDLDN